MLWGWEEAGAGGSRGTEKLQEEKFEKTDPSALILTASFQPSPESLFRL